MASNDSIFSNPTYTIPGFMIWAVSGDITADGLIFLLLRQGRVFGAALLITLPWAILQSLSSVIKAHGRDTLQWAVSHPLRSGLLAAIATFIAMGVRILKKEPHKGRQVGKRLLCSLAAGVLVAVCDIPIYDAKCRLDEFLLSVPSR